MSQATVIARFVVNIRCHGCHKQYGTKVDVPDVEDAPTTISELQESQMLERLPFRCKDCDTPIGTVVSVRQLPVCEEAA